MDHPLTMTTHFTFSSPPTRARANLFQPTDALAPTWLAANPTERALSLASAEEVAYARAQACVWEKNGAYKVDPDHSSCTIQTVSL